MKVIHLELKEANKFVQDLHRHHKPCVGHRFSIGAMKSVNHLCGVAIVGRPVARMTPYKWIVEVSRLCTDGTPNACSFLYAAAAKAAKALGYAAIQTFILADEPGTSLVAAGWEMAGASAGGDWNVPSRKGRRTDQPMGPKTKWIKVLSDYASQVHKDA